MRYLLFDLGNVLVQLGGMPWLREHWRDCSDGEIFRRWMTLEPVQAYERGTLDTETFLADMPAALGAALDPEELRTLFDTWLVGPFPGAEDLLLRLGKETRLGCLSNTNPGHMDKLRSMSNLLDHFDDRFLSYETGHMKPDPAAYAHVLEATGMDPEDVWFFDDSRANIAAAAALGMRTSRVLGLRDVVQALHARG